MKANPIELLRGKYQTGVVAAAEAPGLVDDEPDRCEYVPGAEGWRGCASVCLLRLFLEESCLGAEIRQCPDGAVALKFVPGLDVHDETRLHNAVEALKLLEDARDDIRRLVASGGMRLRKL